MTADYTRRPLFIRRETNSASTLWIGSRSPVDVPEDAILTEDGDQITAESTQYLLTEH